MAELSTVAPCDTINYHTDLVPTNDLTLRSTSPCPDGLHSTSSNKKEEKKKKKKKKIENPPTPPAPSTYYKDEDNNSEKHSSESDNENNHNMEEKTKKKTPKTLKHKRKREMKKEEEQEVKEEEEEEKKKISKRKRPRRSNKSETKEEKKKPTPTRFKFKPLPKLDKYDEENYNKVSARWGKIFGLGRLMPVPFGCVCHEKYKIFSEATTIEAVVDQISELIVTHQSYAIIESSMWDEYIRKSEKEQSDKKKEKEKEKENADSLRQLAIENKALSSENDKLKKENEKLIEESKKAKEFEIDNLSLKTTLTRNNALIVDLESKLEIATRKNKEYSDIKQQNDEYKKKLQEMKTQNDKFNSDLKAANIIITQSNEYTNSLNETIGSVKRSLTQQNDQLKKSYDAEIDTLQRRIDLLINQQKFNSGASLSLSSQSTQEQEQTEPSSQVL